MTKRNIRDIMPKGTPDYMVGAYISCLRVFLSKNEIIEQFKEDTKSNWTPPKSAIDKMIDDSTGAAEQFFLNFVKWFNENVWGEEKL